MSAPQGHRAQTLAVRAGIDRDQAFGAVTPPLVLSSNFSFAGFDCKRRYDYTRSGNPTRDLLAEALAQLEGGVGAVVTSSGMAAVTLVLNALLQPGDRIVVPHDGYGGSWRLFDALARKGHFELVVADLTDPRALADALGEPPALVWIETPSNPLLRVTDLRFVIDAAHRAGALAVVDNTFLSPALQQPIAFGADLVVHSTTKYINGHSDVVGGAVVAREQAVQDKLAWWANALGITGAPFDSFLALRGLRTLDARLRVHQENTNAVLGLLDGHPAVRAVHYPGLPSHPGHAIWQRDFSGSSSLFAIILAAGSRADTAPLVDGLAHFGMGFSFGGYESLILPAEPHQLRTATRWEAPGPLLRLHIGLEDPADLVVDLEAGLARFLAALG